MNGVLAMLSLTAVLTWQPFSSAAALTLDALLSSELLVQTARDLPSGQQPLDVIHDDDITIKHHWALLIAGSAGWGNYRHQADVCHAYQVLIAGGMNPDRIVVMMADDIANNPANPYPGEIFNCPGCPDVYAGVRVDYAGAAVNTTTFQSVLLGDGGAVRGIGSGRVVASGPNDRVFVYYADHGAPGILGMPYGPYLYADDFVSALHMKGSARGYREIVVFVEACESGSIFEGMLDPRMPIFATTAANDHESSWGTYCPGGPGGTHGINTCLGDLYSVSWIENAESGDLQHLTLDDQFQQVRTRTSNNHTYSQGSHAQEFGSLRMRSEASGDYEGYRPRGGLQPEAGEPQRGAGGSESERDTSFAHDDSVAARYISGMPSSVSVLGSLSSVSWESVRYKRAPGASAEPRRALRLQQGEGAADADATGDAAPSGRTVIPAESVTWTNVEQRDAELVPLWLAVSGAADDESRADAQAALDEVMTQRHRVDASVTSAVTALLQVHADAVSERHPVLQGLDLAEQVRLIATTKLGRAAGEPLVDSWPCLKRFAAAYAAECGALTQYAAKHARSMANLCNGGITAGDWRTALTATCASQWQ